MARNDITGDLIASRASNQEKYADGWDAIFGKKKKNNLTVKIGDRELTEDEYDVSKQGTSVIIDFSKAQPVDYTVTYDNSGWIYEQGSLGDVERFSGSVGVRCERPQTEVKALDFHDNAPMKGQLPDGTLYGEVEDVDE